MGKTRLAREGVAAAAEAGWNARWAVGTQAGQPIPLGAFAEWAAWLDGNPVQIVRGVIAALTSLAQDRPVLVAVDDAHRLEDLSALVLHQLVLRASAPCGRTPSCGVSIFDRCRSPKSDAPLESALGDRVDARSAEKLWQLTVGNVLFLRQVVQQELVAGRLAADASGFRWTDPMAEPRAIEECEARGFITLSSNTRGDVARGAHPLYGEVRLAQSGRVRLARLHGQIASAMTRSAATHAAVDPIKDWAAVARLRSTPGSRDPRRRRTWRLRTPRCALGCPVGRSRSARPGRARHRAPPCPRPFSVVATRRSAA